MSEQERKFEAFEVNSFSKDFLDELGTYLRANNTRSPFGLATVTENFSNKVLQQIQNYPEKRGEILFALKDSFKEYRRITPRWDTDEVCFLEEIIRKLPIKTNDLIAEVKFDKDYFYFGLKNYLIEYYREFNSKNLDKMADWILINIKEYPNEKEGIRSSLANAALNVQAPEDVRFSQAQIDVLMKVIEMAPLNFPEKTTKEVKKENEVVSDIHEGRKSLSEFFIEAPKDETDLNQIFRHSCENVAKFVAKCLKGKAGESIIYLEEVTNRLTNEIENANTVDEKKSILSAVANAFERNNVDKQRRYYDEVLNNTIVSLDIDTGQKKSDIKYSETNDHENLHQELMEDINQYFELKTLSPEKSEAIIDEVADKIIEKILYHPSEKKVIISMGMESAIIQYAHKESPESDLLFELQTSTLERIIERAPLKKLFLKKQVARIKEWREWVFNLFESD